MEIFMADTTSAQATRVRRKLEAHGHRVRSCRDLGEPGDAPCAALRGDLCPLDGRTVDVAVGIGPGVSVDRLGDGEVCAIRRRIPLVLLDRPHDPLGPWAAAVAPESRALQVIGEVSAALLLEHCAEGRRIVGDWLRRQESKDAAVDVEVRRRHGSLRVALSIAGRMSEQDEMRLGVYLAQRMRHFDPWAKGIDVSFHHVPSTNTPAPNFNRSRADDRVNMTSRSAY